MSSHLPWRSSRWVPIVGGMILQICGGSIYITGLYSDDLKTRFQLNQSQIEQLVFACNLGNWLPAAGVFNDSRFGGGRNTAFVAAVLTLLGYLGVWAWSAEMIRPAYWQVWFFWFLWGHGSGWFDNAAMATTAKNFPHQRGRSIALMKAFYGLSGSILTQVFNLFFVVGGEAPPRTSEFLLFLGVVLSSMGALAAPLLWLVPVGRTERRDEPIRRFNYGLGVVIFLAVVLMFFSIARTFLHSKSAVNVASFTVMLIIISMLLALVRNTRLAEDDSLVDNAIHAAGAAPAAQQEASVAAGSSAAVAVSEPVPIRQALRRAEFWCLFFVVFVGSGSGLVALNNVGQMVKSVGGDGSATTILVSLMSITNCFGRVAFGVIPDRLTKVPRPLFCFINMVIMCCAQLLIAYGSLPTLYVGAIVTGFAYGGFWTLMPSLISEIFGTASFATLYNVQSLAISSASLVFSTILAARLYDREAADHPAAAGKGCTGATCYRETCLVMAGACVLGTFSALALTSIWRRRLAARSCAP